VQGGDHHRPREIKDRPSACAAHDRPGPSQSPGQNDDKGCTPGLLGRAPPLPLFTTMFLQNFNEDAAMPTLARVGAPSMTFAPHPSPWALTFCSRLFDQHDLRAKVTCFARE